MPARQRDRQEFCPSRNRGKTQVVHVVAAKKGVSHQKWVTWNLLQIWWLAPFPHDVAHARRGPHRAACKKRNSRIPRVCEGYGCSDTPTGGTREFSSSFFDWAAIATTPQREPRIPENVRLTSRLEPFCLTPTHACRSKSVPEKRASHAARRRMGVCLFLHELIGHPRRPRWFSCDRDDPLAIAHISAHFDFI